MVLLIGEGPSYTFHVLAHRRRDAKAALKLAWAEHVKQTGATPRVEDALTINYIDPFEPETVYCDYMRMRLPKA